MIVLIIAVVLFYLNFDKLPISLTPNETITGRVTQVRDGDTIDVEGRSI